MMTATFTVLVTQNIIAYSFILPWRHRTLYVTKFQHFINLEGNIIKGFTDMSAAWNPLFFILSLTPYRCSHEVSLLAFVTLNGFYNSFMVIYWLCLALFSYWYYSEHWHLSILYITRFVMVFLLVCYLCNSNILMSCHLVSLFYYYNINTTLFYYYNIITIFIITILLQYFIVTFLVFW